MHGACVWLDPAGQLVGGMAQWLGRRFLIGGLTLIYARKHG